MRSEHRVVFVAFPGLQILDLVGPLEVFAHAADAGARVPYRCTIAATSTEPVTCSSGLRLEVDVALPDVAGPIDTLVVVGGNGTRASIRDEAFLTEIRRLAACSDRIASVCSGSLLLAAAGLLDGRAATSHWSTCELLGGLGTDIDVRPDQIYVRDGDVWTSAGVTAGIDLALAMVDEDHGPEVAHAVAGWLVVFARRPGGQAQFSAQLQAQAARTPAIAELQRWLPDHLAEDLGVDALARRCAMSPRTFARSFKAETGATPAAHVEALRLEAAKRLLETTDRTVASVATAVGFARAETLHRAFARRLGTTPDRYRQHFAHRP
jgi:transcriptional regulator GlxA family with amidase domain